MSDIVDLLRVESELADRHGEPYAHDLFTRAADRIAALEARVAELEAAHKPMAAAVVAAYEFIRRECAETNPETGEIVDAGALPTWNLVCEGYAYAAASAGEDDTP